MLAKGFHSSPGVKVYDLIRCNLQPDVSTPFAAKPFDFAGSTRLRSVNDVNDGVERILCPERESECCKE